MLIKKLEAAYSYILGDKENYSFEKRIFLSAILIGTLTCLFGSVMSGIITSQPVIVSLGILVICLLLIIYYFIRFKGIFEPFVVPIIIISFVAFSLIWIFSGGMDGPNIMIGFVVLMLALVVIPDKNKKYIILPFIAITTIIYLIQFFRPALIIKYPSENARWLDYFITTIYTSFIVFLIIRFLHKNYTIEKNRAEENEKRLFQLNADKDLFISILAHDLRNPFNTILGFSELLLEELRTYDLDTIEKNIGYIHNVSQKTYDLLEDLLMWTKSQSGKLDFNPGKIDFTKTCQETVDKIRINALSKNIAVNYFSNGEIPVWADENMVKTIIRNLISNAIKFTNPGGRIDISTQQTAETLTVIISDSGVGIDPGIAKNIFEISQRVTTAGTANEKGTGLGLLLCKDFIEKHGGKIWVDSIIGKGSQFKFTLPKYTGQANDIKN
jgi:signal transduction histidine kinase